MRKLLLVAFMSLLVMLSLAACNNGNKQNVNASGSNVSNNQVTEAENDTNETTAPDAETTESIDDTTVADAETTEVVESETEITVDSIIKLFENEGFAAQVYDPQMIATIADNIITSGLTLEGEILEIVHVIDTSVSRDNPDWSWAYVYEFSNEADAIMFEENRRDFVSSTEPNGACVRCGNIVVFGSAAEISTIK